MDNPRPVYSFTAPKPESPPVGIGRILILIVGFGAVVLLVIVASNVSDSPSRGTIPVSQKSPPVAPLVGSRPALCPPEYRNNKGGGFERCVAIDIPGSGEWVRRVNTPGLWEMPTIPALQARGCGGEVYSLAHGGNQINESCGYLDYRVTDGRPKTIIEGHGPLPR